MKIYPYFWNCFRFVRIENATQNELFIARSSYFRRLLIMLFVLGLLFKDTRFESPKYIIDYFHIFGFLGTSLCFCYFISSLICILKRIKQTRNT